jgi:tetratricopeptide (TPR) repeat protein
LIAACAESGRYKEGLEWAKKLRDVSAPARMTFANFVTWAGSSMVRVHVRFGDWQAVPNDPVSFGTDPGSAGAAAKGYPDGLNAYAKGMAALEKGDLAEAVAQSEHLDASLWRLEAAKPKKKDDGAAQDDQTEDPTEILNLLGILSLDLRGNLKFTQGDTADGVSLLRQAIEKQGTLNYTEPPHYYRPEEESLGYAYLRSRQWDKARDAFNEALRERPKSGLILYGIAQSYATPGDVPRATSAYRDFLAAWQHADADLPQVRQAKAWIASHPQ